jgi:hypothetical protein
MLMGEKDRLININEALIGLGGFLSALTGYLFAQYIQVKLSFLPGLLLLAGAVLGQICLFSRFQSSRDAVSSQASPEDPMVLKPADPQAWCHQAGKTPPKGENEWN